MMKIIIPTIHFACGEKVMIGGGAISGIIEEIIFCRGMTAPFYLVEWWQDGQVMARRFHEADLVATSGSRQSFEPEKCPYCGGLLNAGYLCCQRQAHDQGMRRRDSE